MTSIIKSAGETMSSLCMQLKLGWYKFKLDYYNLGCSMQSL